MLVNLKNLLGHRMLTLDNESCVCADVLLEPVSGAVGGFVVKAPSLSVAYAYVVPRSLVELISPKGEMRLRFLAREIDRFPSLKGTFAGESQRSLGLWKAEEEDGGEFKSWLRGQSLYLLSHLRGFQVDCLDAQLGQVKDVYFEMNTLNLKYLAVMFQQDRDRKLVFVSVDWIDKVDWGLDKVYLDLTRGAIASWPLYKPYQIITESIASVIAKYEGEVPLKKAVGSYGLDGVS